MSAERRDEEPGRRDEDRERETALSVARQIRSEEREEYRRRGRLIIALWALTVVFSAVGAYLGGTAGTDAKNAAESAKDASAQAKTTAVQAKLTADSAKILASLIQAERKRSLRASCKDQNLRHDAAIEALDRVLQAAIQKDPAGRQRLEAGRASTVTLINAIVPKRDCDSVVSLAAPGGAAEAPKP